MIEAHELAKRHGDTTAVHSLSPGRVGPHIVERRRFERMATGECDVRQVAR